VVEQNAVDAQFSHREHVTGSLPVHPNEAPLFRPAYSPYPPQVYQPQRQTYPPYPPHPAYPGYAPGYAPYAAYPGHTYPSYAWMPPRPKQDGYLMAMAIVSVVGSSLVLLGGLVLIFFALPLAIAPTTPVSGSQQFSLVSILAILICVCVLGGIAGLYHSIRSLIKKPSADFSLPRFWIFLILYLAVIGVAFLLQARGLEVAYPALTIALIALAGVFPALALGALGIRRLRSRVAKPLKAAWPTSWRRFTVALVSGTSLSILLAFVLEIVIVLVLAQFVHIQNLQSVARCINTPDAQSCQNPGIYGLLLFVVAVVAPVVEETVKPLAVVLLIGRVRSAAEAFALGMACGIGFDLVETSLYISSGYHDWLNIALLRTGAGLLHGFGAAMVALGWYYLIHGKKRRFLRAFACWSYAVLQHAIWNGSWGLVLLPAPIGPFFNNWTLNLGFTSLPGYILINIFEALCMLAFFIYITGKLRLKQESSPPLSSSEKPSWYAVPVPQAVG
jgi:RsiW-degrading membrane proteinase PrsW (M82 family)